MSLKKLPNDAIRLIGSTVAITSVSSILKELVENSIDAGASVIDIKIDKYGIDKIEVRDNGRGISHEDIQFACLPNYTSKIFDIADMESLKSFGFRGQALHCLCNVADVEITTKTDAEDVASTYSFNNEGSVINVLHSHQTKGTVVTVKNLYKRIPVRKAYYSCPKRAVEEFKQAERIVKILAVAHPQIRFSVAHNKCLVWQKPQSNSLRQSMMQMFTHGVVKNLVEVEKSYKDMSFQMMLPKRDGNLPLLCQSTISKSLLFYVNKRPVIDGKVEKMMAQEISYFFSSSVPCGKFPVCLISVTLPPEFIDVNVEPNKMRVFIRNHDEFINILRDAVSSFFQDQLGLKSVNALDSKHFCEILDNCDEVPRKKIKLNKFSEDDGVAKQSSQSDDSQSSSDISVTTQVVPNLEFYENCEDEQNYEFAKFEKGPLANKNMEHRLNEFAEYGEKITEKNLRQELGERSDSIFENDVSDCEKVPAEITISQWSRGNVFRCGGLIQGGSRVINRHKLSNDATETNVLQELMDKRIELKCADPESTLDRFGFTISAKENDDPERCKSSQLDRRDASGFTKFAKELRDEITKETAGVSFARVAGKLANKWRSIQRTPKRNEREKLKNESLPINVLIENRPTARLEVSIEDIEKRSRSSANKTPLDDLTVIGAVSDDYNWLVRKGADFYALNVYRLQEATLFSRNMMKLSIKRSRLQDPRPVIQAELGELLWKLLLSFERKFTSEFVGGIICDPRIHKNGFVIEIKRVANEDRAFIVEVANDFTVIDLVDILQLANSYKQLNDCRTPKICDRIKKETFEMCCEKDLPSNSDIIAWIRYWMESVAPKCDTCVHERPVLTKLRFQGLE